MPRGKSFLKFLEDQKYNDPKNKTVEFAASLLRQGYVGKSQGVAGHNLDRVQKYVLDRWEHEREVGNIVHRPTSHQIMSTYHKLLDDYYDGQCPACKKPKKGRYGVRR
jgi:hypothetical protein